MPRIDVDCNECILAEDVCERLNIDMQMVIDLEELGVIPESRLITLRGWHVDEFIVNADAIKFALKE